MKKNLSQQIRQCFAAGGKLLIAGSGGSAAESSHMAAEFVGIGLPAIAFSDLSTITALSNDFGYENAVVQWLKALYTPGDLFIGISSSGKSKNVNAAIEFAQRQNNLWYSQISPIDFPRKGKTTSEVQNNQLKLIHQIYEEFK